MSQAIVEQCLSPDDDPTTVELVDSVEMSVPGMPEVDITLFAFRYATARADGTPVWTRAEYAVREGAPGGAQCGAEATVRCDPEEIAELQIPRHEHCEWYWQPVSDVGP
jgi:hypothetical protein